MAFKDLREYIERLDQEKEVVRINQEVDWNLEVGAIIRRSYEIKAPAPFFQKIKDYPEGYRIFGAPAGPSRKENRYFIRIATSLGMKPDSTVREIIEEYIKRRNNFIKPVVVKDGSCKENIHRGKDVNLFEFPACYIHEGDGGRYIGTWNTIVTKDPDTGWVNWGIYRLMIHDEKTMGGFVMPVQHIGFHYYQKYEARKKKMEFAVAFGTDPVISFISATRVPPYVNEVDVAGALRGEPVELVKCETNNLEVPASSEIVLEGEILPDERKEEGPYGEYTGYRVAERLPRPVYRVKAITHRNNPILPVSSTGIPVDDHIVLAITKAAEILDDLRKRGFPVEMVFCPPEAVGHLVIVSTKVPFPNYPRHLASAIWGSPGFGKTAWYLIIVEDDVDVTKREEWIWALSTRCHPERGIFKMTNVPGIPLLPYLSQYEREHYQGSYVLMDCTWPKEWGENTIPVKASFGVMWPEEIQKKVIDNWNAYGFE